MSRRRGRDGRPIPTVDLTSEYLEVERRRYHERIRSERIAEQIAERAATKERIADVARRQGWTVTKEQR